MSRAEAVTQHSTAVSSVDVLTAQLNCEDKAKRANTAYNTSSRHPLIHRRFQLQRSSHHHTNTITVSTLVDCTDHTLFVDRSLLSFRFFSAITSLPLLAPSFPPSVMSLPELALPTVVSETAFPTRQWTQSVLLHYKALSHATFAALAAHLHLSEVWTTSAVYGQQQLTKEEAVSVCHFLRVPERLAAVVIHVLTQPVVKGHLGSGGIPTDPCEYRLYEILQCYGSSFQALV
jgi:cyanate lyase